MNVTPGTTYYYVVTFEYRDYYTGTTYPVFAPAPGQAPYSNVAQATAGNFSAASMGTDFWVAFPGAINNAGYELSFCISSAAGAGGTLTIPGLGTTNAFSVAAGAVKQIYIDYSIMTGEYDVVETNGVHITASQPVSVYGVDYSESTSSAFTGYPTTLLGTNYCVMARAANDNNENDGNPRSQFAIVATADHTMVWITPSATAGLVGHGTNGYGLTNLQAGATYQINSSNITDDVTGTWVTSDKPIAVFAGANIARVPDMNTEAANPLVQEQLPVNTWGTNALALSFAGRTNGDSYRILAAYSNTVVSITGTVVTVTDSSTIPRGVTKTNETVTVSLTNGVPFDIIVQGPAVFQANQPIQAAHFANGWNFDGESSALNQNEGDPCEILLPPTGHYLKTNIVFTLANITGDFDENFLNLIVPQSATNSTYMDSSLVAASNYVQIGNSGYYGVQITITNGVAHKVTSSQPVGVEAYGWGYQDAYGYFGGIVK